MSNDSALSAAGKQYAEAHEAHYTTKNMPEALELYKGVIATYPDTQEAEYSRTQIQNIVRSVVPVQEFVNAQAALALVHLEHEEPSDAKPAPVNGHNATVQANAARYWDAGSAVVAREIEKHLLDKGCAGDASGDDGDTRYVYLYCISPSTWE